MPSGRRRLITAKCFTGLSFSGRTGACSDRSEGMLDPLSLSLSLGKNRFSADQRRDVGSGDDVLTATDKVPLPEAFLDQSVNVISQVDCAEFQGVTEAEMGPASVGTSSPGPCGRRLCVVWTSVCCCVVFGFVFFS